MGSKKRGGGDSRSPAAERRRWNRMFRGLVEILRSQQAQIESLERDRRLLESFVHLRNDGWADERSRTESHLFQLKKHMALRSSLDASSFNFAVGLKQKEVLCYKKRWELAEAELNEVHDCLESVNSELTEVKKNLERKQENEEGGEKIVKDTSVLRAELDRLTKDYEVLMLKKESEISALLREKDFVWNQFKEMESRSFTIRNSQKLEIQHSNEAVKKLQENLERLQSENNEKDKIIANIAGEKEKLRSELKTQAQEARNAQEHVARLKIEVREQKNTMDGKNKTVEELTSQIVRLEMDMKRCIKASDNSKLSKGQTSGTRDRRNVLISTQVAGDSRDNSGKRKRHGGSSKSKDPASLSLRSCSTNRDSGKSSAESPRLFSATFRVPKVKHSSPLTPRERKAEEKISIKQ